MGGSRNIRYFRQGGHDIPKCRYMISYGSGFNLVGPTGDHWHANAPFIEISFYTSEGTGTVKEFRIGTPFYMGTIITGKHNDGIIIDI